ncbi:hypothetical protein GE107_06665 [Cohnella sp. CFH 77786]|uniref:hypothetical protein n=1 Tax=Cohnella sp. CFH 77786 TaxID=2662265 RepID=UPI001C608216|nr:hypothetical protein [Cohnella sp. CFH 77786]MBW5445747.1 hypothetical protein [Cohnella sp. CFH 77786]
MRDDQIPNYYSGDMEATVPTPPDQQDVSPIDMVSEAVEEMMDTIRADLGLRDGPLEEQRREE